MNIKLMYFLTLAITFVATTLILIRLIPYLKAKKIGQTILEIGPNWHKSKEGTPTMGGISFVIASTISLIFAILMSYKHIESRELVIVINIFVYSLVNALIGLIDDIAKIKQRKNEGLTARQKFLFQAIAAILFLVSLRFTAQVDAIIKIPFIDKTYSIGWIYYLLAFLMLCGIVNSVNLTDGIDGLASSTTLVVGLMLSLVSFYIYDFTSLKIFSALLVGSTGAFLLFNRYPAKVFMGDTGSLFLGAIIIGSSFITNNFLSVLIYGIIYLVEAVSDILQVIYFKLTKGKRLFKMAPLHHHFEKNGWSENKIVFVFTLVTAIFCIIAFLELKL